MVSRTSCLLGGGLQRRVLLLQGLDLSIQLGNLGIESCDIRAKRLRGLSAGNCLLAKGFHRLGYLIEEVIDFIDVIAFLDLTVWKVCSLISFGVNRAINPYTSLWA